MMITVIALYFKILNDLLVFFVNKYSLLILYVNDNVHTVIELNLSDAQVDMDVSFRPNESGAVTYIRAV